MISASTLIGPFEFDRALATRPLLTCDRAVNNGRVASLLRRKPFVERGLANDGWSGRPSYYLSNGLPDNFTKQRQNGSKLAKRDKFVTHLR